MGQYLSDDGAENRVEGNVTSTHRPVCPGRFFDRRVRPARHGHSSDSGLSLRFARSSISSSVAAFRIRSWEGYKTSESRLAASPFPERAANQRTSDGQMSDCLAVGGRRRLDGQTNDGICILPLDGPPNWASEWTGTQRAFVGWLRLQPKLRSLLLLLLLLSVGRSVGKAIHDGRPGGRQKKEPTSETRSRHYSISFLRRLIALSVRLSKLLHWPPIGRCLGAASPRGESRYFDCKLPSNSRCPEGAGKRAMPSVDATTEHGSPRYEDRSERLRTRKLTTSLRLSTWPARSLVSRGCLRTSGTGGSGS